MVKTYDAYNRLVTETDARGNVKTQTYEQARGLHLGTTYTVVDGTAVTIARSFSYNHLGKMTQVVDDSGVRSFGYNTYGERETDSLVVDGDTHLVTGLRDDFGRSTGYTYAKNGSVLQTVSTGYGMDGRINSAGFLHGGEMKQFGYEYLQGSNLLHKLTKPNGMTLTQSYETQRDLLTGMAYHRGSTLVAQREYTYDVLGRPTARTTSRQGNVVNDTFVHNSRSELASAQVNGETYGYDYDNVGNRRMSMEAGDYAFYEANELNQYTDITGSEDDADFSFTPIFDADGNQTVIKTETGIWTAVYNAENRPVSFTNEATGTVVTCAYDSMGRRSFKKVTVNGTVTLHQRYLYRGYLQIACIDLTRTAHPCLWLITWDPSQPVATRPLAIQKSGTWYTYGLDSVKNVCELYDSNGYILTNYSYTPYGKITVSGNVEQPFCFSSEYFDSEMDLSYFNYRHYNLRDGRWVSIDQGSIMYSYIYSNNKPIYIIDHLGLFAWGWSQNYENPQLPQKTQITVTRYQAVKDKAIISEVVLKVPSYNLPVNKCHNFCKMFFGRTFKYKGLESYRAAYLYHHQRKNQGPDKRYNYLDPGMYPREMFMGLKQENGKFDFSESGYTSLRGRVENPKNSHLGLKLDKPNYMDENVFRTIYEAEFRTGDGGVNFHAGINGNMHSLGCILLGPIETEGTNFVYQESLLKDFEFKQALYCSQYVANFELEMKVIDNYTIKNTKIKSSSTLSI